MKLFCCSISARQGTSSEGRISITVGWGIHQSKDAYVGRQYQRAREMFPESQGYYDWRVVAEEIPVTEGEAERLLGLLPVINDQKS